jgi:hypothetical protein
VCSTLQEAMKNCFYPVAYLLLCNHTSSFEFEAGTLLGSDIIITCGIACGQLAERSCMWDQRGRTPSIT